MEMNRVCNETLGIVELDSTEIVLLNGGWLSAARAAFKSYLISEFVKYAKEAGKAWIDFIQDNPHLFPDGPPENTGASY